MQCAFSPEARRDLTFCHEIEKSSWAGHAKQLLLALHAKVKMAKDKGASALSKGQLQYWSRKYDDLMNEGLRQHPVAEKQKGKRGVAGKARPKTCSNVLCSIKIKSLLLQKTF